MDSQQNSQNALFFNLSQPEKNHWFFEALQSGDLTTAKMIQNEGAILDTSDGKNTNLLQKAALSGNFEMVDFLLLQGISPTAQSAFYPPAIQCAFDYGNEIIVFRLLSEMSQDEIAEYKNIKRCQDIVLEFEQNIASYREQLATFYEQYVTNNMCMPNNNNPIGKMIKLINEAFTFSNNNNQKGNKAEFDWIGDLSYSFPRWYHPRLKNDSILACCEIYRSKIRAKMEAQMAGPQTVGLRNFMNSGEEILTETPSMLFSEFHNTNSKTINKKRKIENELAFDYEQEKGKHKKVKNNINCNHHNDDNNNNNDNDSDDDCSNYGMDEEPNKFQFKF